METSLHRQLKQLYTSRHARQEVTVDGYRIDVVRAGRLIEIQHASLSALRTKVARLLSAHDVTIVKPLVTHKLIIKHAWRGGPVVSRRQSPKRGTLLDIFDELVYFTTVFPNPRLAIEVLPVAVEEWRYPGHGRRRRWRRQDCIVDDQKLVSVGDPVRISTPADLLTLLKVTLPASFHTGDLAELLGIKRSRAQQIAYCLRKAGSIEQTSKQRNAIIYRSAAPAGAPRRKPRPRPRAA